MAAAKKIEARVKRLREQALQLSTSGKPERAAEVYAELTELDPTNGEWPRRAADCYLQLKDTRGRLKYALLAAQAYSDEGLLLKAIAMCKVVLSIDPNHKETQAKLAQLHPQKSLAHARRRLRKSIQNEHVKHPEKTPAQVPAVAQRLHFPQPATKETEERSIERTRSRLAAAAALRQARAQLRKEALEKAREKRPAPASTIQTPASSPQPTPEPNKPPRAILYLGPVHEEVVISSRGPDVTTHDGVPHDSTSRSRRGLAFEKTLPAFRLTSDGGKVQHPPLESLRLSERVPAQVRESSPPAEGNIYSLTLSKIPQAELRAARLPKLAAPPPESASLNPRVPVIEPLTERPTPLDSLIPNDLSFSRRLSGDRAAVSQRNFSDVPLLCDLDQDVLERLITDVALVELETNQVLFHEGDPADAMYVVVEGSVTAVTLPHGEKPIELAQLKEGDFFGEIGLMGDQPRQATVTAHEPCRLLRFDREIVAMLIETDPTFLSTLLEFIKNRLIENLMMSSPLFTPFSEQERRDLAEQFEFLEIEPNSLLLEKGQHPIGMYVLLTGEATLKGATEAGTVRRLGQGDIFGEQALLENTPSRIEVRTASKCFALCLPSDAFPEVVLTRPAVLQYLSTLHEDSKGELDLADDFLDHVRFF